MITLNFMISNVSFVCKLHLLCMKAPHALKGQKLLAQGIALGFSWTHPCRPVRAKALKYWAINKAFALTGRLADCYYTQGAALG